MQEITTPKPHFSWGSPTKNQISALKQYIDDGGDMSIYGDTGIYEKLERFLSRYYNQEYIILTNTGTSALNSAYVGIGIEPGDEVIVPTYTFLATVTPLLRIGAVPVFADGNKDTGNIDPEDIERKITEKTKAIAVTHMWGVACDMEKIMEIAKIHNLKVVEDCSHAHFTPYKNKLLGTYGDVACFSIGARKTLTSGEGGFIMTNNPSVYIRANLLGHFEVRAVEALERIKNEGYDDLFNKYSGYETGFGENYRMHPYSAVMSHALLDNGEIFEIIKKRRESLEYFTNRLNEVSFIDAPVIHDGFYEGAMYGYKGKIHANKIKIPTKEAVLILRNLNMEIKIPDSTPLHKKPLFLNLDKMSLGYDKPVKIEGDFPGATEYFSGRVSLPTFTRGLEKDKTLIDQYVNLFKAFEVEYGV